MPHILKNKNIEIHIDLPTENYSSSRFDWTGKIVNVMFQNIQLASVESLTSKIKCKLEKAFTMNSELTLHWVLMMPSLEIGFTR